MKKAVNTTILFILVSLTALTVQAKEVDQHKFKIHFSDIDGRLTGVSMKIFKGSDLVEELNTALLGFKTIKLEKNTYYTIEVFKKGYHPRRIVIDTKITGTKKAPDTYSFDFSLYKNDELIGINHDILDFPAAIISYNKSRRKFHFDVKYNQQLQAEYSKLNTAIKQQKSKENLTALK